MLDKLRIGAVTYDVKFTEGLRSAFNDDGEPLEDDEQGKLLNGQVIYHKLAIEINPNVHPAMQPIVVLHEALHAVLGHAGIEHDESTVMALGYGVADLLRDNPELVRLIVG